MDRLDERKNVLGKFLKDREENGKIGDGSFLEMELFLVKNYYENNENLCISILKSALKRNDVQRTIKLIQSQPQLLASLKEEADYEMIEQVIQSDPQLENEFVNLMKNEKDVNTLQKFLESLKTDNKLGNQFLEMELFFVENHYARNQDLCTSILESAIKKENTEHIEGLIQKQPKLSSQVLPLLICDQTSKKKFDTELWDSLFEKSNSLKDDYMKLYKFHELEEPLSVIGYATFYGNLGAVQYFLKKLGNLGRTFLGHDPLRDLLLIAARGYQVKIFQHLLNLAKSQKLEEEVEMNLLQSKSVVQMSI